MTSRQRLPSKASQRLAVLPVRLTTVGKRAFPVSGAILWNSLPCTSRHISTVSRDLQAASQDITRTPADPPCCALSTRTLYCTQKYSLITFAVRLSSAILETKLIPVLSSQPAGNRSHKPSGRLPLLSARPAVTSRAAEHKIQ